MKWLRPKPSEPSAQWHIHTECKRFYIAKSLPGPVYTLADDGVLVLSGTLDECKRAAEARA